MHDVSAFLEGLSKLPVKIFQPGEVILHEGQTTGRLFVLKQGAVAKAAFATWIMDIIEGQAVLAAV